MSGERTEADAERGMAVVSRLRERMPDEVSGPTAQVYEDIRTSLRVPFVNFIFRVLANYEEYLVAEWTRLRPWVRTRHFEQDADALRASVAASLSPARPDAVGWAALGDLARIGPFTESIQYVLPKLLLIVTSMHEALEGSARPDAPAAPPVSAIDEPIPQGIAAGTLALPMVDPAQASPEIRALFDRIKDRHGHPGVATYYRSLAAWPQFLRAAWERIDPMLGTPDYAATKRAVLQQAGQAVRHGGSAVAGSTGGAAPAADLRDILAVFRFRVVPDLLLDVTIVRILLDGAEAAKTSRFSVA